MAPPKKINLQELETWLGVGDAVKELGLSRQGVRNMLERGELLGVKTRVGWLIDPASARAIRLLRQDDAERRKREERDALIRRASQTNEVRT